MAQRIRITSLFALLALLLPLATRQTSAQQITPEVQQPRYAVATRDMPLYCGRSDIYYVIGDVSEGEVLEVVESSWGWSRVRSLLHPLEAYINKDDTRPGPDANTVITREETHLLAPALAGIRYSYRYLVDVPGDTTLNVLETFEEDGKTYLRVQAPRSAAAWLPSDALRDADDAEIAAYLEKVKKAGLELNTPNTEKSQPADTTVAEPPAEKEPPAAAEPETETTTETPPAADDKDTTADNTETETQTPALVKPEEPKKDPLEEQAEKLGVLSPKQLRTLAKALLEEDVRTAELAQGINEFRRSEEALDLSEPERKALAIRRQMLEMQLELQDTIYAAEQVLHSAEIAAEQLRLRESVKTGTYTARGTLYPSAVYDGTHGPKLYRLQSPASLSGRTVVYIEPAADGSTMDYIGKAVEVTGDVRYDDQLHIYILNKADFREINAE